MKWQIRNMQKDLNTDFNNISIELSRIIYRIINLDSEIAIYETKCRKYSLQIDTLQEGLISGKKLSPNQVANLIEYDFLYNASKVSKLFKCNYLSESIHTKNSTFDVSIDLQIQSIINMYSMGFRSKDASYNDKLNILAAYGIFYDKVSLVEFFCHMKYNMFSCEGIENNILDSCCDNELKDFASILITLYEKALYNIEFLCIENLNMDESRQVLKYWLTCYAVLNDDEFINEEIVNKDIRHENYIKYINLSKKWLECEEYLESLIEIHSDLCVRKESLIKKKENIYFELYAKSIEKKKAIAWNLQKYKANQEYFYRKINILHSIKNTINHHALYTPFLESVYHMEPSYLDSRDWASVK